MVSSHLITWNLLLTVYRNIHYSSIHSISVAHLSQGHEQPEVYPMGLEAQGGGHPGRGSNHSHIHTNSRMPIRLKIMSMDWGRKPEHLGETPEERRDHAHFTHTAGINPPTP